MDTVKFVLSVIFCLGISLGCSAQAQHPIDLEIMDCYSANSGKMGMMECEAMGYRKWLEEVNKNYDELMGLLPPDTQLLLKQQQLKWEEAQAAEVALIEKVFKEQPSVLTSSVTDIARRRALQLQAYLDVLREQPSSGR